MEQPTLAKESNGGKSLPFPKIADLGQLTAFAIAVAYVCGFIEATAYLGGLGIKDYDAFRIQYLVAGIIFCLTMAIVYYFVGRQVSALDEYATDCRKNLEQIGHSGRFWTFCAGIFPVLRVGNGIVISSFLCASLLFNQIGVQVVTIFLPAAVGTLFTQPSFTNTAPTASGRLFLLTGIFYVLVIGSFSE